MPVSAGADAPVVTPGMELVFSGESAQIVRSYVVFPVSCIGDGRGFCSGVMTLSHDGRRASVGFSVSAGVRELVHVHFRLGSGARHRPFKVHGVATTDQRLGPPSSTRTFLYARETETPGTAEATAPKSRRPSVPAHR